MISSFEANKKNLEYWNDFHKNYGYDRKAIEEGIKNDEWMWIFKDEIEEADSSVIDLGCGDGSDTLYLLNKGKKVIPCDGSINAIHNIRNNFPEVDNAICFDMLDSFPFMNNDTDLIVADLSLHYFTREDTIKILKEIRRVLKNRGHLLFRVNSVNDLNHGAGQGVEIEPNLYMTSDGRYKRFFSSSDIYQMFNMFNITYLREEPMKRYKLDKQTFVGRARNIK